MGTLNINPNNHENIFARIREELEKLSILAKDMKKFNRQMEEEYKKLKKENYS